MTRHFHTVILGAGAAGMMCAAHAGADTLVIDHAKSAGEKIRISGGGRCNFTNLHSGPDNFLSQNRHFAKSALARYTQWDFIDLVTRHGIAWHEKTLGQLFCDGSAKEIIAMLLAEMAPADLWLQTTINAVKQEGEHYHLSTSKGPLTCRNLVIATGGKSIPKMGATGFGYEVARQFGHRIVETRPGLVPLTFSDPLLSRLKALAGLSLEARVTAGGASFEEGLLFTHRGLSGPSILQASSYWREGEEISLNLMPEGGAANWLKARRREAGRKDLTSILAEKLPARLVEDLKPALSLTGNIADWSDQRLEALEAKLSAWRVKPSGSEGYRTAEVTLGGVDTDGLNARTLESKHNAGLYFIGEVVDVTGWLGGFNFQWAWSSGWAAGCAIAETLPAG